MKHDGGEDSARVNSQAAGRKIIVDSVVGTNARNLNVFGLQTDILELQATAFPEVDMPLLVATGDLFHPVTGSGKLVVDLIAHLEILE